MRIREVELKCWTRYIIGAVAEEEEEESKLGADDTTVKTVERGKKLRTA